MDLRPFCELTVRAGIVRIAAPRYDLALHDRPVHAVQSSFVRHLGGLTASVLNIPAADGGGFEAHRTYMARDTVHARVYVGGGGIHTTLDPADRVTHFGTLTFHIDHPQCDAARAGHPSVRTQRGPATGRRMVVVPVVRTHPEHIVLRLRRTRTVCLRRSGPETCARIVHRVNVKKKKRHAILRWWSQRRSGIRRPWKFKSRQGKK